MRSWNNNCEIYLVGLGLGVVSAMPADVSTSHEVAAGGTTVPGEAVHMGTDGLIYNDIANT